jgi:hypothetical protein
MTTKIIAFSGKKQSGKSTCSNFIYANYLSQLPGVTSAGIDQYGCLEYESNNAIQNFDIFDYYHNLQNLDQQTAKYIGLLNQHVKIYSFADILKKQICVDILGLEHKQCYGTDSDKNSITHLKYRGQYITAREAMQIVGTDFFRELFTDIWPQSTIRKIQKENPSLAIINDCRFPNEVEYVKKNNGIVIRLTRHNHAENEHRSEKILDKDKYDWNNFDYVLDNQHMNIHQQCEKILEIMKDIK